MNRQKHSLPRRVLAILLMAAMLITMLPSAMLANGTNETTTDGTKTWQISKSKTATNLDENYQSEVTLSLPAAQEQLESDVVFVLDKSTSAELEQQALDMLDELNTQIKDTGAKVNVGVVIFNKQANRELELTELNDDNMDTIEAAIKKEISSGTNTHAGLLAGKAMLDADTDVDANRKYLVFVSDGITYMYNETPTVTAWSFYADAWNNWAAPDNWNSKYGTNDAPADWDAWMSDIGQKVEAQGTTYEYPYGGTVVQSTPQDSWQTKYAMSIDKALYLTNQVYNEIKAKGYHCYAMIASANANHPWASSFMDYLADGAKVSFTDIQNDIYYLVGAGSTVDDYMGYVDGEDGYNFDLVINDEDLSNLYMTVETLNTDGKSIKTEKLKAIYKGSNQYGFDRNGDGVYEYELEYTPADNGEEHFTWKTNVSLTNFERVQLHYTVKLMNPQTAEGTYGTYDADGSKGYDGLYTNNSATIYPVDSNVESGTSEAFAKPTVSYTVEPQDVVLDGDTYLNITKKFMGSSWPSNEKFQFEIKAADNSAANTPLPEETRITIAAPSNGSENSGAFGDITYTEPGTYIYTITEVEGNHDNIIYDDHVLTITVTVDEDMNIAVDTDGSRTFTNIRWNDEATPGTTDEETPDLNTQDHYSYIVGYPEDYRTGEATDNEDLWPVKPQGNITRAEVATIFYRLLTDEARAENWTQSNDFTDVSSDDWFNTPVSTLSAMGILTGYEDGSFQPNAPITRAEFAAIAVRFYENDSVDYTDGTFSDITGSEWFADAVQAAKEQGIIGGYPDGSFQPNKAITRAEACSIVNRTLDRVPHEDYLLPDTIMRTWPDNQKGAWYYADIQEATNGHEYEWVTSDGTNHENWTGDRDEIDWDEVERELEALHGVN